MKYNIINIKAGCLQVTDSYIFQKYKLYKWLSYSRIY